MLSAILQEITDIVTGAVDYMPVAKISIGIGIGLAILTMIKGRVGIFITFILLTYLVARSFLSQSNLYQISLERVLAGIVIGLFVLCADFYLFVTTFASWRD